jgi:hypothetical protein
VAVLQSTIVLVVVVVGVFLVLVLVLVYNDTSDCGISISSIVSNMIIMDRW